MMTVFGVSPAFAQCYSTATALAVDCTAVVPTGLFATAVGFNANATGSQATAYGNGSIANGALATATGWDSTANGISATATGAASFANGENATATGTQAGASGANAILPACNRKSAVCSLKSLSTSARPVPALRWRSHPPICIMTSGPERLRLPSLSVTSGGNPHWQVVSATRYRSAGASTPRSRRRRTSGISVPPSAPHGR